MKNALLVRMGGFVLRHEPLGRVPLPKRSIQVDSRAVLEETSLGAYREELETEMSKEWAYSKTQIE